MATERPARARRRFGQHYLVDDYIIDRIIELARPTPAQPLLEIGPGGGVLTGPLVASGAHVEAVEIDRDLAAALRKRFRDSSNLVLHEVDILQFDFARLRQRAAQWQVVGNLPYNISTPLIMRLLNAGTLFSDILIMVQREVAERLAAPPGSRAYGRLGIAAQRRAEVHYELDVPASAFDPPPRVASSVLRLVPRERTYDDALEATLDTITRTAFAARRKTVSNALRKLCDSTLIKSCGLDPRVRPESLSPADYETLARAVLDQQESQ